MKRESLEELLERGESIEKIAKRFGKNPSTVSYWLAKYGLVSARGSGLGIATLRAEAAKCILVCSNCHALVEAGAVELPLEFRD